MTPQCIWAARAELGESPLWHDRLVYWVDIVHAQLCVLDPATGSRVRWTLPFAATCLVPAGAGRLIAASASGFYELDSFSCTVGRRIAPGVSPGLRTNDGACDPWGALWYGTMDLLERKPRGRFHRLHSSGNTDAIWGGFAITNGPAFDLARGLMFVTDTLARRIYRGRIDRFGLAGELEVFHQFDGDDGYPDGMAVDEQGSLWCAMWAGRKLVRLSAGGDVQEQLALPVSNPTKCAFGGGNGTTLFVTTARKGLSLKQLAAEPLAGGLFAIETQVRGAGVACFARPWVQHATPDNGTAMCNTSLGGNR
ncbi:SMP-30/gluconolactonase/LRE family protein [Peristeroidobacter agariperforans]|uniref:SMP-30/gluconolactonase/LRE family protein n=1 Tax=Peristeroidobacter agariperforans TaxID=268404 RepID=UPI0013006272|nr:SMP-30/gluconolactonase/LRE family protein [Peristeroidobacter agariperforans]